MIDPLEANPFKLPSAAPLGTYRPLPSWLARRLLRRDEQVTWVRGPRWNPGLERYITHPGLFLFALALAALCLGAGWLHAAANRTRFPEAAILVAAAVFFGAVLILAYANAYFTRLVVTNFRLMIVQGYELCKIWNIHDLPLSLRHYGRAPAAVARAGPSTWTPCNPCSAAARISSSIPKKSWRSASNWIRSRPASRTVPDAGGVPRALYRRASEMIH